MPAIVTGLDYDVLVNRDVEALDGHETDDAGERAVALEEDRLLRS